MGGVHRADRLRLRGRRQRHGRTGEPVATDPRRAHRTGRIGARRSAPSRAGVAVRLRLAHRDDDAGRRRIAHDRTGAARLRVRHDRGVGDHARPSHARLPPAAAGSHAGGALERLRRQQPPGERQHPPRPTPRRWTDGSGAGFPFGIRSGGCRPRRDALPGHRERCVDPGPHGAREGRRDVRCPGRRSRCRRGRPGGGARSPFAAPGGDDGARDGPARVRRCVDRGPRLQRRRHGRRRSAS